MLAAIIFGAVLAQERTVTFTHPCAHSSVVLEAFGREIGETIKPGRSVNKDYFLVRFDGMPVEDAKAAIAKTLKAKWEMKDGTLYLTRTRAMENQERSEQGELLKEVIEKEWGEAGERSEPGEGCHNRMQLPSPGWGKRTESNRFANRSNR